MSEKIQNSTVHGGSIKTIHETLKTAKNPEFEKGKFLVVKFVKPENLNFPREIKISKKLLTEVTNDEHFWDWMTLFPLNSLAYFLTWEGKVTLEQKLEEYEQQKKLKNLDFPPQKEYALENKKIGDDKKIESKPKNLVEMLS